MKLSTKVRYGMRAVVEIAHSTRENKTLTISTIAESQQLSQKYLESLLVKLKKRKILQSLRGQKGGYLLNKAPGDITVYDIAEALDGEFNLVDCSEKGETCPRLGQCSTINLWTHLTNTLVDEMKKITISDLIGKDSFDGGYLGE
ncbi:MAG: Rrf2 family transcriptional regulator [Spirochaetaceae bacterium]|nr:Rrf2 family transcriptional regulator [Spirochaetaceae bacterium]